VRELATESVLGDVVDERSLAVDLHDREPLAISRLQLGIAADVDLLELEAELVTERSDGLPRSFAEVAALRVVEDDARDYG
jgi:hypothetical protein